MQQYKRDENGLIIPVADDGPHPSKSLIPLPSEPGIYTITHEMAGDWLDNRIPPTFDHQRKMSQAKVKQRTEEMNAGLWGTPCPPGLMFNTEGWCFNGQHTLQALRNSDLSRLDLWVFPDQPHELFAVVDTQYARQARQLYGGKHATAITSAVRYLGEVPGIYITKMSVAAQLEAVKQWPELVTHASGVSVAATKSRIPATPHLAVLAQAERTEYRDRIPGWLEGVTHGLDLRAGDPRLLLRERFLSSPSGRHRSAELIYNTIAKAWNNYASGRRLQLLHWRATEGMITVIGTGADLSSGVDTEE